jgi:ABC-2 type transport system permease protein
MSMLPTVVRIETRLFLREPVGLLWGYLLPVIAFTVMAVAPATSKPQADLGGLTFAQVYLPIIAIISMAMLALMGLPAVLASYRERGVLRRLSVTPLRPWRLLAAQVGIHLVVGLVAAVTLLVVASLTFDGGFPGRAVGWLIAYPLMAVSLLGLATLIAALVPSGKLASGIGSLLFFPLMFLAGLWWPQSQMPPVLRTISEYSPLGSATKAMTAAVSGDLPPLGVTLALAGYAVVFSALALRTFRWE